MKNRVTAVAAACLCASAFLGSPSADASIIVGGTRIVYNGQEREVTVKLGNEGALPALTQVWLDNGDTNLAPAAIEVPFVISPPLTRIEPGRSQTLRVFYSGEALPKDKETLFWLNVLEVAPKPTGDSADSNTLQLAFRTRLKFFFRPEGLDGQPAEAPGKIQWRVVTTGTTHSIEARNPTPYHVTFAKLEVIDGDSRAVSTDAGMVGPGEVKSFRVKDPLTAAPALMVRYQSINDHGGLSLGETAFESIPASE
ncbi:chaperone protein EcpD [Cupriavidus sp. YR651]|uniref:fimbria/pilus periplasmic chaperone n=1 Tax=Cupriavidus sp. YR651 TaxID=1855315 RepID=UPI000890BE0C|nr:fimbria/pilus periplasmic chaperone [Cupriavidus sp. YR651]SDD37958.1 chaperone protein EcpD [Cupriavidus sp. YR651]